jgi:hypothetical protein
MVVGADGAFHGTSIFLSILRGRYGLGFTERK